MHEKLFAEESQHLIDLALGWAKEKGMNFPLPAVVREVHHPVTHFEVLSAPYGNERTCVLIDNHSQLLNVERRPVQSQAARVPWWKKLLGLNAPPS
jgi:hypothetical protein